jgi:DNA-directed RNA polymerase I, II, and III subunit RPABC5
MIIPVRCFTCGKVIGNKYERYLELTEQEVSKDEIFRELNLSRYCCKRMLTTHVELIDLILEYSENSESSD